MLSPQTKVIDLTELMGKSQSKPSFSGGKVSFDTVRDKTGKILKWVCEITPAYDENGQLVMKDKAENPTWGVAYGKHQEGLLTISVNVYADKDEQGKALARRLRAEMKRKRELAQY